MRRIRSRLNDSGAAALAVSGVSLVLALCCSVLLVNHFVPCYGARVRPGTSRFIMGSYDRSQSHIVSIAAGETPRIYVGSELVPEGIRGLEPLLDAWKGNTPSRVMVVLMPDCAVSSGTVQQVVEMVMRRGMNCSIGAIPDID